MRAKAIPNTVAPLLRHVALSACDLSYRNKNTCPSCASRSPMRLSPSKGPPPGAGRRHSHQASYRVARHRVQFHPHRCLLWGQHLPRFPNQRLSNVQYRQVEFRCRGGDAVDIYQLKSGVILGLVWYQPWKCRCLKADQGVWFGRDLRLRYCCINNQ